MRTPSRTLQGVIRNFLGQTLKETDIFTYFLYLGARPQIKENRDFGELKDKHTRIEQFLKKRGGTGYCPNGLASLHANVVKRNKRFRVWAFRNEM